MSYEKETSEAIKRIDRLIQEWEENYIDGREMVVLLMPDLKTIICYFERIQIPKKKEVREMERSLYKLMKKIDAIDTSKPIGRAMLKIFLTLQELESSIIKLRISELKKDQKEN